MPSDEQPATEVELVVRSRFAEAHLEVDPHDLTLFVMMYPVLRAKVDRLYELELGDAP